VGRPVQPACFSVIFSGEKALIRDLGGGFAATIRDVEAGNGGYAVPGAAEGV